MDRLELHSKLVELLGSSQVYYQPPETIKMVYPCIVYNHEGNDVKHADNTHYVKKRKYQITYISLNPDDEMLDTIQDSMPMCNFDRKYVADNLYHYSFTLFC